MIRNVIRYVARRLVWKRLGSCRECGANMDWGQPVRRPPNLVSLHHYGNAGHIADAFRQGWTTALPDVATAVERAKHPTS